MANFCINCGSKLEDNYNYCINCGTRVDDSDIKQIDSSLNKHYDSIEKKKAKQELNRVIGGILSRNTFSETVYYNGLDYVETRKAIKHQVEKEIDSGQIKSGAIEFRVNQLIVEYKTKMEKEKEEEMKKLKIIEEIFESEEIKSEIRKSNIGQIHIISIKDSLKDKLINKKENMSEDEIRYFIKSELKKVREEQEKARIEKEKERRNKEMKRNETVYGGYCGLSCSHCYEEFFDSDGGIVGDFTADGYTEYYCSLGHSVSYGSFCEDYD